MVLECLGSRLEAGLQTEQSSGLAEGPGLAWAQKLQCMPSPSESQALLKLLWFLTGQWLFSKDVESAQVGTTLRVTL